MKLCELKWACEQYAVRGARYDASLRAFRTCVAPAFDLHRPDHMGCLFKWLNKWGCRQFTCDHHEKTAAPSLIVWADTWLAGLPMGGQHLTDLSPAQVRECADAYEALRDRTASFKARGGSSFPVTFGDTGAAKTLFGVRPLAFTPWDEKIRRAYGVHRGDSGCYEVFLMIVAGLLEEVAAEAHAAVSELPRVVRRPDSSPPKLIDEYNFITITLGLQPPPS